MKNIILLLFVLFSGFAFAQEKSETKIEIGEEKVDKMPEFPGGINEFRTKFTKVFRSDKVKYDKRLIRTIIIFYVEKDGNLSDIKAYGGNHSLNDEAIRAISKIKDKWNPAEIKGEKVRSKFNFPLSMSLE